MVEKTTTWLQVQVWRTFAKLYEKKFNANNRYREGVKIFIRERMIRDAARAVRRQSETSQGINTPPQRSFIHGPAARTNTPTSMPIEAGSLQEENTPTDVQATIRNIWGGQKNSRKRSVPGHPGEWRIIMNTQKSFALFYSFTTSYYFIFLDM